MGCDNPPSLTLVMFVRLCRRLAVTRALCKWKGVEVIEQSVQLDHIHLVCSIPPKVAVEEKKRERQQGGCDSFS
jgi:REP element-mobilizing transposase RayT